MHTVQDSHSPGVPGVNAECGLSLPHWHLSRGRHMTSQRPACCNALVAPCTATLCLCWSGGACIAGRAPEPQGRQGRDCSSAAAAGRRQEQIPTGLQIPKCSAAAAETAAGCSAGAGGESLHCLLRLAACLPRPLRVTLLSSTLQLLLQFSLLLQLRIA